MVRHCVIILCSLEVHNFVISQQNKCMKHNRSQEFMILIFDWFLVF